MEVYDLQFSKTDNPGGYNFQFITRYTFIYAQAMLKTKNIYITHTIHGVILLAQKKKRKNLGLFYNTMKKKNCFYNCILAKICWMLIKPYLVTENSKEHLYIMTGNKLLCTQNSRIIIKRIIYMPLHIGIIMSIHYSHNDEQSESY